MWFRYLIGVAACAALVGLAASGLVRLHLSGFVSAMAPPMPTVSPSDVSVQPDGDSLAVARGEPEGTLADVTEDSAEETTEDTPPETQPASSLSRDSAKGRRGRRAHEARSTSRRGPAQNAFTRELDRGVRKLGKRRYEIKRGTLELALRNLPSLSRSVRVAPELLDGKPVGFRLFAIEADGPVAKLGLRNEDVLVAVNGLDITTPDRVLNAYGKLKTARHLVLTVVRGGRTMVHEYSIR